MTEKVDISEFAQPVELPPVGEQMPVKYDLGCGERCAEGFKGVDLYGTPDIQFDLMTFPWTFAEDNSVDELYSSHFFEHIPGPTRIPWMDECWRILKPQGKLTIIVPYYSSMRAIQDPTHAWPPVAESSFLYFNRKWREDNKLGHYLGKCDFDFSYAYIMDQEVMLWNQERRDAAIKRNINTVNDLQVTLVKRE